MALLGFNFLSPLTKTEDLSALTDEEILERSIREPALFEEIVCRYEKPFRDRALRLLGWREEVEDVVQDTFVKIYTAAPRFRAVPGASFRSWAYAILKNTAFSKYQKEKRETAYVQRLDSELLALIPESGKEPVLEKDRRESVARVLANMPATLAKVLRLYFLEGKSQREIASLETVSVGAVKTRMHRAKEEFRSRAKDLSFVD
jgi:RNA polymerase sigma-70 factor (ECF subfamily)